MKTKKENAPRTTLLTVGHSNRPLEDFLQTLQAHGVKLLVDVRSVPRSRHNPQFNGDTLPASLRRAKIAYRHLKDLGGLRHARKDSVNTGWRNASFRGFADYMQTKEFAAALEKLEGLARKKTAAIMCAEAVPWRCHRSLIADALALQGWRVEHIFSRTQRKPHEPTPFLKVRKGVLTYPGEQAAQRPEPVSRAGKAGPAAPRAGRSSTRRQKDPRRPGQ
jgi:uncharacterized protein (DUF488 family)